MVGQKETRNPMIFAKDENVGGASVHSYRSQHKLYKITNHNQVIFHFFSHRCPSSRCLDTFPDELPDIDEVSPIGVRIPLEEVSGTWAR